MRARALLIGSSIAMLSVTVVMLLRQPVGPRSLRYQLLLKVAAPCNYGEQAYQFSPLPGTGGNSSQWNFQARDERCRLQPLVSALLAARREGGWPQRRLSILFNGDRCGCAPG